MAKVPKNVLKACMTAVHQRCGLPKKHKTCASNFLSNCISTGRKTKKFTVKNAMKIRV